jgi:hypothetical protein
MICICIEKSGNFIAYEYGFTTVSGVIVPLKSNSARHVFFKKNIKRIPRQVLRLFFSGGGHGLKHL